MIHEIGVELQTELRAKDCPFAVVDGPEEFKTTAWTRERIVIERTEDPPAGPPRGARSNPDSPVNRSCGGKLTIYAKSPLPGAMYFEHQRRAEQVLDLSLVALRKVLVKRKNGWTDGGGGFFIPPDLDASARFAGAAYERKFSYERSVDDLTWAGAKDAETTITRVSMAGNPALTFAEVGATGDTITRSAGSWLTDGFTVGMTVTVGGTASNNVTGTIAGLTATVLTFGTTDLVNEGPISNCKVTAGGVNTPTQTVTL